MTTFEVYGNPECEISLNKKYNYAQAISQQQVAKCPVCDGSGKYREGLKDYGISTRTFITRTCHGCSGKGWVVVPIIYGIR